MNTEYSTRFIRPNHSLRQAVDLQIAEVHRMRKIELAGWCVIVAFLVFMNVGAARLVLSMILH